MTFSQEIHNVFHASFAFKNFVLIFFITKDGGVSLDIEAFTIFFLKSA